MKLMTSNAARKWFAINIANGYLSTTGSTAAANALNHVLLNAHHNKLKAVVDNVSCSQQDEFIHLVVILHNSHHQLFSM